MKNVRLFMCLIFVVVLITGCSADNNTLNNVISGDSNNPQNLITSITLVDSSIKESVDLGPLIDKESLSIYKEIVDSLSELKPLSVGDSYDIDFPYQIKSDTGYESVSTVEYHFGTNEVVFTTNQDPSQYAVSIDSDLGSAIEELHHRFNE